MTGSFILIDAASHATVAAGMVSEILSGPAARAVAKDRVVAAFSIPNLELLRRLETALLEAGVDVVRTRAGNHGLLERLFQAGVVVLIEAEAGEVSIALPGTEGVLSFAPIGGLPEEPAKATAHLLQVLANGSKK